MPTMTRSAQSSTGYVPMAVEVYGAWGEEAQRTFSRLATRLSVKSSVPRPEAHITHQKEGFTHLVHAWVTHTTKDPVGLVHPHATANRC